MLQFFPVATIVGITNVIRKTSESEEDNMIKIHYSSAEQVATKMENAADQLEQSIQKVLSTAEKTNLQVNTDAQYTNDEAGNVAKQFHQHFVETLSTIQSVAVDFKRVDEEISQSVEIPGPINNQMPKKINFR